MSTSPGPSAGPSVVSSSSSEMAKTGNGDGSGASSAPSSSGGGAGAAGPTGQQQQARKSNLQRIQQRKAAVRMWPKDKKIEKLAIYSACRHSSSGQPPPPPSNPELNDCKCNGWKNPNPPPNPPRPDSATPQASPEDPCRTCDHPLADHVSQLHPLPDSELDRSVHA